MTSILVRKNGKVSTVLENCAGTYTREGRSYSFHSVHSPISEDPFCLYILFEKGYGEQSMYRIQDQWGSPELEHISGPLLIEPEKALLVLDDKTYPFKLATRGNGGHRMHNDNVTTTPGIEFKIQGRTVFDRGYEPFELRQV